MEDYRGSVEGILKSWLVAVELQVFESMADRLLPHCDTRSTTLYKQVGGKDIKAMFLLYSVHLYRHHFNSTIDDEAMKYLLIVLDNEAFGVRSTTLE